MSGIDFLYDITADERLLFGSNWVGPASMEHGKETLVATYPAEHDGQPVDVYCTAMPARFYKLVVKATGDKPGYTVSTGSGCASWAAHTAYLIAHGMVGFTPTN